MNDFELTVLNPRGERGSVPQVTPAAGLRDLSRKNIGIILNGKPAAETLLPYLKRSLANLYPDTAFQEWKIPFNEAMETKAPKLNELARSADGVIALIGD